MEPIRPATPRDIPRIMQLMRAESNAVGFIPEMGLRDYVTNGRCAVATYRNRTVAYLLGRPSLRYARWCRPITQLVVHEDFRRRHIATRLLTAVVKSARDAQQHALQAWTRTDIDHALQMWHEYGWDLICERLPETVDKRPIQLWRKRLTPHPHQDYWTIPPVAGHKAAKITTAVRCPPRE